MPDNMPRFHNPQVFSIIPDLLRRYAQEAFLKKLLIILSISILSLNALAGDREIAWKLHNRIAGVPPTMSVLNQMTGMIAQGDAEGAAYVAMENKNFYNVTLKNWIKPWSNRDQTPRIPFNDYVATIMGVIKEDLPFDSILYDDIIYTVNNVVVNNVIVPYSNTNNDQYAAAENQR